MMCSRDPRTGQSILEVLVATAVGSIMIVSAIGLISPALRGNQDVARIQAGAAMAKETIEQVRVLAESDWHSVSDLATSSANTYFVVPGTTFTVATGTESMLLVQKNGLVGHWKFDESSGDSAFDSSGNGNTGTLTNSPARASGTLQNALAFNGSATYMGVPSTSSLKYTGGNMTIALWVFVNPSEATGGYLVSKPWNGSGQYNYTLSLAAARTLTFGLYGNSIYTIGTTATVPSSVWTHLAMTVNSSGTMKIYMNGSEVSEGTHNIANWTPSAGDLNVTLALGTLYPYGEGWAGNTGFTLDGKLDDVRFYTLTFSETEIEDLYKAPPFYRNFYVESVNRDGADVIAAGAGAWDPSTLKLTVNYNWVGGTTSTMTSYLMRAANKIYRQTDWFSGAGQDGPATSTNSQFSTSSNMDWTTTPGSIQVLIQ